MYVIKVYGAEMQNSLKVNNKRIIITLQVTQFINSG